MGARLPRPDGVSSWPFSTQLVLLQELAASDIGLESIERADLERINELLEQYADSHLDFVDAALVTIAERHAVTRVLTLDRRDFGMIRPKHCDHFDLIP